MTRQSLVGLGLAVSLVSWAVQGVGAQGASQDAKGTAAKGGKTMTLTGCLAKGSDASSFMLNDAMPATAAKEQSKETSKSADMKSYHVMTKDSALKLADHVGHRVTLTGTVDEMAGSSAAGSATSSAGGRTGSAAGTGAAGGTTASGTTAGGTGAAKGGSMAHLTVTSMKHVAATCTQ